jgi:phosphate starvation-inducible membrane PsiE
MAEENDALGRRGTRIKDVADKAGLIFVASFHLLALFAIGATIVWAATFAFFEMVEKGHASVEDILLLFIYLELGAMVGIYFATNHMPVRFLIYVALTALTRLLIGMVNFEHLDLEAAISTPHWGLVVVTGGIFVLALSALVLRYASFKYPSDPPSIRGEESDRSD